MKNFKTTGVAVLLGLAILTTSASCNKEAGMDGAAGKNGANGAAGANGQKGDKGDQGEPGSANLKAASFEVTEWVYDEITKQYMGYILNNDITDDVLDNGIVQVFIRTGGKQYSALPATTYPSANASFKTNYSVSTQQVRIELQYPDLKMGPFPGNLTFKVVVMGREFAQANKINFRNYEEVSAYLGAEAE